MIHKADSPPQFLSLFLKKAAAFFAAVLFFTAGKSGILQMKLLLKQERKKYEKT